MENHATEIFVSLFVIFLAAQVGAELAQRLKMPAVVGEIAAGVLVGPSVLNWIHVTEPLTVLAEIGAVILLFSVGLETRVGDLRKVGAIASWVGVLGVILPFVLGGGWAHFLGYDTPQAMFIGAAFVATSAGITARVLHEMGVLGRKESRIILGAAVIDDILAMLLLGVVTALQGGEGVKIASLLAVLVQAVGFVVVIAWLGTRAMRKASDALDAPISPHSPLSLTLALCLGLSAAAAYLGLAAIIGAFLAGMVAAETRQRHELERRIQSIMVFVVPFFFVVTGAQVSLEALSSWSMIGNLAIITLLATVGKLVGCGLGALPLGLKGAATVGVGMVPRGEVGIIVASLGRGAGVFGDSIYALIIGMSLLTSVIAPPFLKFLMAGSPADDGEPGAEEESSHLFGVEETGHGPR